MLKKYIVRVVVVILVFAAGGLSGYYFCWRPQPRFIFIGIDTLVSDPLMLRHPLNTLEFYEKANKGMRLHFGEENRAILYPESAGKAVLCILPSPKGALTINDQQILTFIDELLKNESK